MLKMFCISAMHSLVCINPLKDPTQNNIAFFLNNEYIHRNVLQDTKVTVLLYKNKIVHKKL